MLREVVWRQVIPRDGLTSREHRDAGAWRVHSDDMRTAIVSLAIVVVASAARPCTTFCMAKDGEVLYGRNYDFEIGQGYVMTNRRGVMKTSTAGTLRWTSRFASVTFNQWGREFPMDGMNEAGLVIALMWLDGTVYPSDGRPSLSVLEWIQYQLDNRGTVADLLAHAEEVRIAGGTPLHYLIADATGDAATIEYLEGQLVVHRPAYVLTNDTYARSMARLRQLRTMPAGPSSLDRFARASMLMERSGAGVEAAFSILASVAQPITRWSVVYDARRLEISWVSDRSRTRKVLRLDDLALDCASEAKMLDIHSNDAHMQPYSAEVNRQLVLSSYAQTSFTRNSPERYAEEDAAHAESFSCAGPRRRSVSR
jgi:choloylglycine hydrolase